MPDEEQDLRAALEAFERELDRMLNQGEIQQANELVACISVHASRSRPRGLDRQ